MYRIAPLKDAAKQIAAGKDPHARKDGDSDAVADWRSRMGTEAAKLIYRLRGPTAELVNAQCRNRRLWHMPVRGRPGCRIVGLLYAIAHNLVVVERLRLCRGDHHGLSAILRKRVNIGRIFEAAEGLFENGAGIVS